MVVRAVIGTCVSLRMRISLALSSKLTGTFVVTPGSTSHLRYVCSSRFYFLCFHRDHVGVRQARVQAGGHTYEYDGVEVRPKASRRTIDFDRY